MLGNIEFRNCFIVKMGNEIRPMILISTREDVKTKLTYYIYKDFITGIEYIVFEDIKLHKISYYMDDVELDNYVIDKLSDSEILDIIARAMKEEQDVLKQDVETAIKKLVK